MEEFEDPKDDLPEGWRFALLQDICEHPQYGWTTSADTNGRGTKLLRTTDISKGEVDWSTVPGCEREPEDVKKYLLSPGDILVSRAGSVGVSYVVKECPRAVFASYLIRFRPLPTISTDYIGYFLKSPQYWNALAEETAGIAIPNVNASKLKKLKIPVAPVEEQERIVAMLEELLTRVNAVRERLIRVKEIMKRFRQSVLAAACSGRLTENWRDNAQSIESGRELIKRVLGGRKKEDDAEWETAGRKGRRAAPKPNYFEFREVKIDELPEIPEDWQWAYLPFLGYMNRGKSQHRPRNAPYLYGGSYPFIQTGDIAQSGGNITSHRQTYSEEGLKQSRLWPEGTVCITIAANIAHSGILSYPACFPDSVVGVIPDSDLCRGEFLEYFIRTARSNLDEFAPATSQKNINIAILSDLAVAVPPLMEQTEIVRRVEMLFKLADKIEKRVEAELSRTEKMTQAVLAKAFRGELVSAEGKFSGS